MLKELVEKNRSYRGYDSSHMVTREQLEDLVDHARITGSGMNMQPLRYFLTTDPEQVKRIVGLTGWAMMLKDVKLPHEGNNPTGFIIMCHDLEIKPNRDSAHFDIGISGQTMLLRAVEMGLGGCLIKKFKPDDIAQEINLDTTKLSPVMVVAVGKPREVIEIIETKSKSETQYYRDENDVHYLPKHSLQTVLLN